MTFDLIPVAFAALLNAFASCKLPFKYCVANRLQWLLHTPVPWSSSLDILVLPVWV